MKQSPGTSPYHEILMLALALVTKGTGGPLIPDHEIDQQELRRTINDLLSIARREREFQHLQPWQHAIERACDAALDIAWRSVFGVPYSGKGTNALDTVAQFEIDVRQVAGSGLPPPPEVRELLTLSSWVVFRRAEQDGGGASAQGAILAAILQAEDRCPVPLALSPVHQRSQRQSLPVLGWTAVASLSVLILLIIWLGQYYRLSSARSHFDRCLAPACKSEPGEGGLP